MLGDMAHPGTATPKATTGTSAQPLAAPATGPATRTQGIRARNRAAIEQEILEVGRQHLARHGAAALSLRAIARDMGMVSSALYRYVRNRDDLLTLLIVSAYTSLADAVEAAHAAVDPWDLEATLVRRRSRAAPVGAGPPPRVRPHLRLAGTRLRGAGRDDERARDTGPGTSGPAAGRRLR